MTKPDTGLVWEADKFEFDQRTGLPYGTIAKGWKKWFLVAEGVSLSDAQWRITDVGGLTQEVQKTNVKIGLYRQNRGFIPGRKYRVSFGAYLTAAQQKIPTAAVGIQLEGRNDFPADSNVGVENYNHLQVGAFKQLEQGRWTEISHEFTAEHTHQTIFLIVDLEGVNDGVVSLSHVKIEGGAGNPGVFFPWMETGSPPVEPPYIYGIHDPNAEHLFNQKGRQGWVVHALALGSNVDQPGQRFSEWVDGHGVIVRLSHLFGDDIPPDPADYDNFATVCANFVKNSTGAGIWSIGNETRIESPGATAANYALCFAKCRQKIKQSRPGAQVITAGMMHGDVDYFRAFISAFQLLHATGEFHLGENDPGIDGFAIHSYTNSEGWNQATFAEFEKLMAAIPEGKLRELPVYMTEAGSGTFGTYVERSVPFVNPMFKAVHDWNQKPETQKIRSVNLYRWAWKGDHDKWGIEKFPFMQNDFQQALEQEFFWRQP